jgi:hypothetical protein
VTPTIRRVFRRRHSAYVENPIELRMGGPQYGRLVLDRKPLEDMVSIEHKSLLWSVDRRLLAAQAFVSGDDEPVTSVVVVDAEKRTRIARSSAHRGLCTPLRFEDDALVYVVWRYRAGERELSLPLPRPDLGDE